MNLANINSLLQALLEKTEEFPQTTELTYFILKCWNALFCFKITFFWWNMGTLPLSKKNQAGKQEKKKPTKNQRTPQQNNKKNLSKTTPQKSPNSLRTNTEVNALVNLYEMYTLTQNPCLFSHLVSKIWIFWWLYLRKIFLAALYLFYGNLASYNSTEKQASWEWLWLNYHLNLQNQGLFIMVQSSPFARVQGAFQ